MSQERPSPPPVEHTNAVENAPLFLFGNEDAHPRSRKTRLAIYELLRGKKMTPKELRISCDTSEKTIENHLKRLQQMGIAYREIDTRDKRRHLWSVREAIVNDDIAADDTPESAVLTDDGTETIADEQEGSEGEMQKAMRAWREQHGPISGKDITVTVSIDPFSSSISELDERVFGTDAMSGAEQTLLASVLGSTAARLTPTEWAEYEKLGLARVTGEASKNGTKRFLELLKKAHPHVPDADAMAIAEPSTDNAIIDVLLATHFTHAMTLTSPVAKTTFADMQKPEKPTAMKTVPKTSNRENEERDRILVGMIDMASALGNESMLRIITALRDGPKSIKGLCEGANQVKRSTLRHLATLQERGFVEHDEKSRRVAYKLTEHFHEKLRVFGESLLLMAEKRETSDRGRP